MHNGQQGITDRVLDALDPARLGRVLLRPRARYVLAWLTCLVAAGIAIGFAWVSGNDPRRGDGNWMHANIDFGGQWLMGRMIVEGHGRQLYHRSVQREVLERAFPRANQNPDDPDSDADKLLDWMVGKGDLGGPLYPPVHALWFTPLALLPSLPAYRVMELLNLALVFVAGWQVRQLTHGRVWWPVATTLLMVFPGYAGAIDLGQNPLISLLLLLLGWRQLGAGRPVAAGVVWGLLAFKPVWAVSFFLVPVLTGRWRFAAAMLATGLIQIALTLPVVGYHTWLDWLQVGQIGAEQYRKQEVWIFLSRDLSSIFRRWMLHFEGQVATNPDRPLPTILGLGLWVAVLAVTVAVVLRVARTRRSRLALLEGPGAAFVLLGAWFSSFHFMYYDMLLTALPVCLLFTEPSRYLRALLCRPPREPLVPELVPYYQPRLEDATPPAPLLPGGRESRWVWNSLPLTMLVLIITLPYLCAFLDPSHHYPPLDMFCLLVLWGWCGWQWVQPASGDHLFDPSGGSASEDGNRGVSLAGGSCSVTIPRS